MTFLAMDPCADLRCHEGRDSHTVCIIWERRLGLFRACLYDIWAESYSEHLDMMLPNGDCFKVIELHHTTGILRCSHNGTPILRNETRPYSINFMYLLLFLLVLLFTTTLSSTGLLAGNTTRTATTVRRGEREVNVLLRVETDHEGRHVDNLLADAVSKEKNILAHVLFPQRR